MNIQLPTYSKILKRKKPSILFHYTTPLGLLSISTSKKIWATDLRFLNDKKEIQHSLDITHSIIKDFYKVNDTLKNTELNYEFIEFLRTNLGERWNPEVYVVSFTEEGDLLSQWRGYCATGGFSIGFDFKLLSKIAKNYNSFLVPCVYDFKIQKQIVEELLVSYNKIYNESLKYNSKNNPDELANKISNEFIICLLAIAPMLKHESFKEEKEWRIVNINLRRMPHVDIKFRANESNIIPYIEISLCQSDKEVEFKKIFIGPVSINEYSKEAVSQLLRKSNVPQNAIVLSSAPYRCT
jgi:hypothetical protein